MYQQLVPQGYGFIHQGLQPGYGLMPDQQGFISPIPQGYGFIPPPDQQSNPQGLNFGGGSTEQPPQPSPIPTPGFGYNPPDQQSNPQVLSIGGEDEGEESGSDDNNDKKKKRKKEKKGPSKPKKPRSAYLFFSVEKRKELKKDMDPEKTGSEITKEITNEWKSMTEEEKSKYIEMADEDKLRYENEREDYDMGL